MQLSSDAVHVWIASLDSPPETFATLLDDDERARAARFGFEVHRRRFVVAHGTVRLVLGGLLALDPASLHYVRGPHGKPEVDGRPLHFNLAHTGDSAAIAVARDRAVGVDIEQLRPLADLPAFAALVLTPAELADLENLPPLERDAAVLRAWTRKEALVKALGVGLRDDLTRLDVGLGPADRVVGAVTVRTLAVGPSHVAAVAAPGQDWAVRVHT